MGIRKLRAPMRFAGDGDGPFNGDGPLRVLIDLPREMRQVEPGRFEGPVASTPEHVLWGLCQSPEIEMHWLAGQDEHGEGVVHLQEPDLEHDIRPFGHIRPDGSGYWMNGIRQYQQLVDEALRESAPSLDALVAAAVSFELRTHITVTSDPELLGLTGFYARHINPMSAAEALGVIGLYLRRDNPTLIASAPQVSFTCDHHTLAWSAVRSQLPHGWAWGSALVEHSTASHDDYATLLFGSFYERLVRMLQHRDVIHRATLGRATNSTGNIATEALDIVMFNIVGAFDAAAIAAHMAAGLPLGERFKAGWQRKQWRKDLGVRLLDEMFQKKGLLHG